MSNAAPVTEANVIQDIITRKQADNARDQAAAQTFLENARGVSTYAAMLGALACVLGLPVAMTGAPVLLGIGLGGFVVAGLARVTGSLVVRLTERKVAKRESEILTTLARTQAIGAAPAGAAPVAGLSLPFDAVAPLQDATPATTTAAPKGKTPAPK